MIKICVKAFYLALSALIGQMTYQHVCQEEVSSSKLHCAKVSGSNTVTTLYLMH